jgi:hypothetical protein
MRSLLLEDDDRREAQADQRQVEQKPSGTAVAVEERVELLKVGVKASQQLGHRFPRAAGKRSVSSPCR